MSEEANRRARARRAHAEFVTDNSKATELLRLHQNGDVSTISYGSQLKGAEMNDTLRSVELRGRHAGKNRRGNPTPGYV